MMTYKRIAYRSSPVQTSFSRVGAISIDNQGVELTVNKAKIKLHWNEITQVKIRTRKTEWIDGRYGPMIPYLQKVLVIQTRTKKYYLNISTNFGDYEKPTELEKKVIEYAPKAKVVYFEPKPLIKLPKILHERILTLTIVLWLVGFCGIVATFAVSMRYDSDFANIHTWAIASIAIGAPIAISILLTLNNFRMKPKNT